MKQTTNQQPFWKLSLNWIIILVIMMIVSPLFFRLNQITGYTADDFLYHFIFKGEWPSEHPQAIQNVIDLVASMITHTASWNGRFVAHTLVQIFMQFPKLFFNLANTFVFLILGILINLFITPRFKLINFIYLGITYWAMFLFLPDFGRAVLWLSGSFNYLWVAVLYLLYLLPLRWQYVPKHLARFTILMTGLGLLVGATNENVAPVILIAGYGYYTFSKKAPVKKYIYPSLFALLYGFLILITHNKGESAAEKGQIFQIKNLLIHTVKLEGILLAVLLLVLLILCANYKKLSWQINGDMVTIVGFTGMGLISIGALILSPQIPARTFFGSTLFFMIAILTSFKLINQLWSQTWLISILMFVILAGTSLTRYTHIYPQLLDNYRSFYSEQQIIIQSKHQGNLDPQVPEMSKATTSYSAYKGTAYLEIGDNSTALWENTWMAQYYGVHQVIVNPDIAREKLPAYLNKLPFK